MFSTFVKIMPLYRVIAEQGACSQTHLKRFHCYDQWSLFNFMEEIWRDIFVNGEETLYKASSLGRISSRWKGSKKIMHSVVSTNGYPCVNLTVGSKKYKFSVHRLVAKYFLPDFDESLEVNHIDGVKTNAAYWNLEMTTRSGNELHAYRIGLKPKRKGEDSFVAKLKNDQVLNIFNSSMTCVEIGNKYGIDDSTVSNIRTGKRWSHITGKKYEKTILNADKIIEIYKSKDPTYILAEKFNVDKTTITSIRCGENFSNITGGVHIVKKRLTIKEIIDIFNSNEPIRILAKKYSVHFTSIKRIKKGTSHSSVTKNLTASPVIVDSE